MLEEFNTNNKETVTLSSLGEAITKSVTIAEIVKHRVAGLHQVNEISTIVIDDEYEPIEEGLEKMTVSRKLTCLQIVLSKKAPANKNVAGYQEPIPASEVNPDAGPEDDGRRQNQRRGKSARPAQNKPADGAAEEEKKQTPSGGAAKDGEARGGNNRRRRPRGGSGDNRRGGRDGRRGGGQRDGGDRDAADAGAYNPFGDNQGTRNANESSTPGQSSNRVRGGRGGDRGAQGNNATDGGNQNPPRSGRRGGRGGQGGRGGRGGGDPYRPVDRSQQL